MEIIAKHSLTSYENIHILPLETKTEEAMAIGLQFKDRAIIVGMSFSEKTHSFTMPVQYSYFKNLFDWANHGFVRETNLATGSTHVVDSLELFSNYRQLAFEVSSSFI